MQKKYLHFLVLLNNFARVYSSWRQVSMALTEQDLKIMGKSIMFIKQNLVEAYAAQERVSNSGTWSKRGNCPKFPQGVESLPGKTVNTNVKSKSTEWKSVSSAEEVQERAVEEKKWRSYLKPLVIREDLFMKLRRDGCFKKQVEFDWRLGGSVG